MRHGFYVYYRIEAANEAAALASVMQLFQEVGEHEGIQGRLLKRADDPMTWMEIYEEVVEPARFQSSLHEACLRCGLLQLIRGASRHVEHFQEAN